MPANYPTWNYGITPDQNPNAYATRIRVVHDVHAIRVRNATYRKSRPIDGVFEVVSLIPQAVKGGDRYEVYCAWFGVKPPTKYPRIFVAPENCEVLTHYSGDVIDNISE
jgi:hypothetical protein